MIEDPLELLIWGGLLALAIAVVVAIGYFTKKMLIDFEGKLGKVSSFSVDQLRQLHRDGYLNDEEFERVKAIVIRRDMHPLLANQNGSDHADVEGESDNREDSYH